MASTLDSIVAYHRARAAADDRRFSDLQRDAERVVEPPSLLRALVRPLGEPIRVIAEVKRRSPSAGELSAHLDVPTLANAYEQGGAAAVSVLTDGPHFGGSPEDLAIVRTSTSLPVLRKDFTVCANDVADARLIGASAVLLIVAVLSRAELREFHELALMLGLSAIVEVHDEREQELAMNLGALIVGVNQRDLRTFEIDPTRAASLAGRFPSDVVTVAESGLRGPAAAGELARAGYDAVLVGEALVRAGDPASTIREFIAADGSGVAA